MQMRWLAWPLAFAAAGCSDSISLSGGGRGADFDEAPSDTFAGGTSGSGDGDTGRLPGEIEEPRLALQPALTDVYVFIAAPERDTVTRVNVRTLEVRTIPVGDRPTIVRTLADKRRAVVFNADDDSVTVLDGDTLSGETIGVRANLNAMQLSPDGRWAVLWYDALAIDDGGTQGGGASSFNEVSLVDLDRQVHVPMVVGFNPAGITFTPDGRTALVVSDASLAVLDLTSDDPLPRVVALSDDPLTAPTAEEVQISRDGTRAFVRQRGRDVITVVDLALGTVDELPVGQEPTDLDLTPDGAQAVVVSRGAKELTLFTVDDPFAPPRIVPFPDATPFGSVDIGDDGGALLFTTATATNRYATWDIAGDTITLRAVVKPISAIARTPDGSALLVVHPSTDAADGTTPEPYRGKPALSMISLADQRANTLSLSADVEGFANSPDGRLGYVILEGLRFLEVLDYRRLLFDEVPLPSVPAFLGVLPDLDPSDADRPAAWISQEHPLGRLSFWDPDDAALRTLTGFELNAGIEE